MKQKTKPKEKTSKSGRSSRGSSQSSIPMNRPRAHMIRCRGCRSWAALHEMDYYDPDDQGKGFLCQSCSKKEQARKPDDYRIAEKLEILRPEKKKRSGLQGFKDFLQPKEIELE